MVAFVSWRSPIMKKIWIVTVFEPKNNSTGQAVFSSELEALKYKKQIMTNSTIQAFIREKYLI